MPLLILATWNGDFLAGWKNLATKVAILGQKIGHKGSQPSGNTAWRGLRRQFHELFFKIKIWIHFCELYWSVSNSNSVKRTVNINTKNEITIHDCLENGWPKSIHEKASVWTVLMKISGLAKKMVGNKSITLLLISDCAKLKRKKKDSKYSKKLQIKQAQNRQKMQKEAKKAKRGKKRKKEEKRGKKKQKEAKETKRSK